MARDLARVLAGNRRSGGGERFPSGRVVDRRRVFSHVGAADHSDPAEAGGKDAIRLV